ncbi:MAG: NAD(P)(+) transhydrogenase (Re/Si-specific) subunit beta, partial [Thermoplasmata archaeon]|nr:NAD(P)(+) transhydrogenase (Re/Si-specific) subunit beta [Candidatus Sysuiplasma superficiale]
MFPDVFDPVYIIAVFFFIVGLHRMSHPLTARSGIVWAGWAMLLAILVTFLMP